MKTASISGFGGSYEWACQRMLQLGMEYLKAHPDFDFSNAYTQFRNIAGIAITNTNPAKELDFAMMADPRLDGATGAMHQAVVNHLAYIHRHGYDKWIKELSAAREPGEVFEFDGTVESVPTTEFSREMDGG